MVASWRIGQAEFQCATGRLVVQGAEVEFDRTGAAILARLVAEAGRPVSKDELLAAGWPGRTVHENSLAKAVSRIRQALGPEAGAIVSVYGRGYRLKGLFDGREGEAPPQRLRLRLAGWRLAAATLALGALMGGAAGYVVADEGWRQRPQGEEALVNFLTTDLLTSSDPYATSTESKTVRELVEHTADSMDPRFADRPETLVPLHRAVAATFSGWGEYEKAVAHLDRARAIATRLRGPDSGATLPVDVELCQQLRLVGDTRRGERACQRAVDSALRRRSPLLPAARVAQAKLHFEIGQYEDAAATLKQALEHPGAMSRRQAADAEWFYGLTLRKLARFDDAEAAFRRHIDLRLALDGESHPLTGWAHADYGDFLVEVGRYAEAESELAAAEKILDARLGPNHPESLSPRYTRAIALLGRGEAKPAAAILRPMLGRYREALGSDHFWTLYVMTELALAEAQAGGRAAAVELLREARLTGARVLYGREGKAAYFHMRWARAFAELARLEEAEDETRRAAASLDRAHFADDHPWRSRLDCTSARIALARGDQGQFRDRVGRCRAGLEAASGVPSTYPALTEARRLAAAAL